MYTGIGGMPVLIALLAGERPHSEEGVISAAPTYLFL